jgi:phosphonate transport system substrate-binding protein
MSWVRVAAAATALYLAACSDSGTSARAMNPPSGTTAPAGAARQRPAKLTFAVAPTQENVALQREYGGLTGYLASHLEAPVELVIGTSYPDVAAMLLDGRADLAILPAQIYVRLKKEHEHVKLLVSTIMDGETTYNSYLVVRDDSGVDRVEKLAGRRMVFGQRESASGYLYPVAYFDSMHINPEAFFAERYFARNQDDVVNLVLSGRYDAGAVSSRVYKRILAEHPQGKHLRILAKTGRPPFDPLAASPRLDDGLADEIRRLLLSVTSRDDDGKRVLQTVDPQLNGFAPVRDEQYDDVRRVARIVTEIESRARGQLGPKK